MPFAEHRARAEIYEKCDGTREERLLTPRSHNCIVRMITGGPIE
jgi:hypothetical protein